MALAFGEWLWDKFFQGRDIEGRSSRLHLFGSMRDVIGRVCLQLGERALTCPLRTAWKAMLIVQLMSVNNETNWSSEIAETYDTSRSPVAVELGNHVVPRPIYAVHLMPNKDHVQTCLKQVKHVLVMAVEDFANLEQDLCLYIKECFDSVEDILSVLEQRC